MPTPIYATESPNRPDTEPPEPPPAPSAPPKPGKLPRSVELPPVLPFEAPVAGIAPGARPLRSRQWIGGSPRTR